MQETLLRNGRQYRSHPVHDVMNKSRESGSHMHRCLEQSCCSFTIMPARLIQPLQGENPSPPSCVVFLVWLFISLSQESVHAAAQFYSSWSCRAKHCVSCVLPALGVSFLGFKPSGLHALHSTHVGPVRDTPTCPKDRILQLCRREIKPSDTGLLRLCGMRLGGWGETCSSVG